LLLLYLLVRGVVFAPAVRDFFEAANRRGRVDAVAILLVVAGAALLAAPPVAVAALYLLRRPPDAVADPSPPPTRAPST
jgi:hypothetical protein